MIIKQKIVLFSTFILAFAQLVASQGTGFKQSILNEVKSLNGDVNGDGQVGIADVTELIDFILGNVSDSFIAANADVDGDNYITIADITHLTDFILVNPTAQPSLTVTPMTINMGNVPVGMSQSAKIEISGVNLSDPITMSIQETHGGEFSVNTTSLPATGGTLTVIYTPEGSHSSSAQLTFKSGSEIVRVIVNGRGVQSTITVTPDTLYFDDSSTTKTFTVKGSNLVNNLTLTTNNSLIAVSPSTITATEAASGCAVRATINPTVVGNMTGYITISSSGAASKKVVVIYRQQASITISPSSYDFGTINQGETVTNAFTVKGTNTTGTLLLASTEMIDGQFTVYPTTLPATGGIVRVSYNPTEVGNHAGFFTVSSTNDGVIARATYRGMCVAPTPPPTLIVSTTSLDFGTVVKGDSKSKIFTITGANLTDNVTMTFSSTASQYFTFSPTEISNPNGTTTVIVTYRPTAVGYHAGTITIKYGTLSKTVIVSGTCVDPTITVTPDSIWCGNVPHGSQNTKTFTVTGSNLTGNLTVNSSNKVVFSVSPTSITPAQAAAGATVTVTYSPSTIHQGNKRDTGTITVSGGGASSKTVAVSGRGIEASPY